MEINAPITLPAPVTINAPLTFGYLTPGTGEGGTEITVEDGVASAPIGPGGALRYWYVFNDPPP